MLVGLLDRAVVAQVQHAVDQGHARQRGGRIAAVGREGGHARPAAVVGQHDFAAHVLPARRRIVVRVQVHDQVRVVEAVRLRKADRPQPTIPGHVGQFNPYNVEFRVLLDAGRVGPQDQPLFREVRVGAQFDLDLVRQPVPVRVLGGFARRQDRRRAQ